MVTSELALWKPAIHACMAADCALDPAAAICPSSPVATAPALPWEASEEHPGRDSEAATRGAASGAVRTAATLGSDPVHRRPCKVNTRRTIVDGTVRAA